MMAPKTIRAAWNRTSHAPMAMKIARKKTAPQMPKNRIREWYFGPIRKNWKTSRKANTLSIDSDHSSK